MAQLVLPLLVHAINPLGVVASLGGLHGQSLRGLGLDAGE